MRPAPFVSAQPITATQAWADLVERRTGRRPSRREAQRQIDALAGYFSGLDGLVDKQTTTGCRGAARVDNTRV